MIMFSVKLYIKETEVLLAACDSRLLGETLRSDGVRLTVSKTFYHNDTVDEKELMRMMSEATSMNLVGNATVGVARKLGLVSEKGAMTIGGEEHAQIVRM